MIALKDLGEFFPPSPKCSLLGTIQRLAVRRTQDVHAWVKTKAGGGGLKDRGWLGSFGEHGKPVEWEEAFTFMAVLCGGDLGHAAFSRGKGNGKKPTLGDLSPYDSDMSSDVSFI